MNPDYLRRLRGRVADSIQDGKNHHEGFTKALVVDSVLELLEQVAEVEDRLARGPAVITVPRSQGDVRPGFRTWLCVDCWRNFWAEQGDGGPSFRADQPTGPCPSCGGRHFTAWPSGPLYTWEPKGIG